MYEQEYYHDEALIDQEVEVKETSLAAMGKRRVRKPQERSLATKGKEVSLAGKRSKPKEQSLAAPKEVSLASKEVSLAS